MTKIVLYNSRYYKYFADYIKSIFKAEEICDQNNFTKNANNIFSINNIYNTSINNVVINMEQLTREDTLNYINLILNSGRIVIDYSKENQEITKNKNHYYIPYQITDIESNKIRKMLEQPKIYDIAICSNDTNRRKYIIKQLQKSKKKIINVIGWNDVRDNIIAQSKILINIHAKDDYKIFESLRCDRWILNGLIVLSEDGLNYENLDIKNLCIATPYDNLVNKALEILNNYDKYYNEYMEKLKEERENIVLQRKQYMDNFFDKLD